MSVPGNGNAVVFQKLRKKFSFVQHLDTPDSDSFWLGQWIVNLYHRPCVRAFPTIYSEAVGRTSFIIYSILLYSLNPSNQIRSGLLLLSIIFKAEKWVSHNSFKCTYQLSEKRYKWTSFEFTINLKFVNWFLKISFHNIHIEYFVWIKGSTHFRR